MRFEALLTRTKRKKGKTEAKHCQMKPKKMTLDLTLSAIACAADFRETAIESFEMAKEVVKVSFQPMTRPPKKPAEHIEVDYDGDDNTIISGWTDIWSEVESVVIVAQPSMMRKSARHSDSLLGYISPSSSSDDSSWSPSSNGYIKSKISLQSSQSSVSTSTRGRSRLREYF